MSAEENVYSGVRVIMDDLDNHPFCPHGPTILFERKCVKYFACSACRNRKDCNFYMLYDTWKNCKSEKQIHSTSIVKTHKYSQNTLDEIFSSPSSNRAYCHTCSMLYIISSENDIHGKHITTKCIDNFLLLNPSRLLKPLENNKKEAQYLFSDNSVKVIINIFLKNKLKNIICLGTPRIHDKIQQCFKDKINSILLDIDGRHQMFYPPNKFIQYNIFNHHFFNGEKGKEILETFLASDTNDGVSMVMDPPFGGRLEILSNTLQKLSSLYNKLHNKQSDNLLPLILVLPYFMEPQIKNHIGETLNMSDYQITYENHNKFQEKINQKSVVRMFTNIPLTHIDLPKHEGYKYCELCCKWIGSWNHHCSECNACTSKQNVTYSHCNQCNKCVKPKWKHCHKCKRCHLPEHLCGDLPNNQICFNCQKMGHKKVDCPKLMNNKRKISDQVKATECNDLSSLKSSPKQRKIKRKKK